MSRTRIKICGVCRVEDARRAADLGADAIGMIFHPPSRRNISQETARAIVQSLGAFVTPVGVFVDAPPTFIHETVCATGLQVVQMHGHERADDLAIAAQLGVKVIKAVKVDQTLAAQLDYWRKAYPQLRRSLTGIVLETGNTKEAGGTGVANDFARIRQHMDSGDFEGLPRLIVAGGLAPDNVEDVVRQLRPWAVDVSSGTEESVGRKSENKLRRFFDAVGRGDCL